MIEDKNTNLDATRKVPSISSDQDTQQTQRVSSETQKVSPCRRGKEFFKSDLEDGMVVRTSDGRYGVVVMEDATDQNCIKLFYDPNISINHGIITGTNPGNHIIPLDRFTEDLKYICSAEEATGLGIAAISTITLWSISDIYKMSGVWHREICFSSCSNMYVKKDSPDSDPVGYCKAKDNAFVGFMEDIHAGLCYCDVDLLRTSK